MTSPSPADHGYVPVGEQADEELARVDFATLSEDDELGRWWFFLLNKTSSRAKPNPGAFVDLGPRTVMPSIDELDRLLHERGLTAYFGGWRAVEGTAGARTRSTRVTTIESANQMDSARAREEASRANELSQTRHRTVTIASAVAALLLLAAVFELPNSYYVMLRLAVFLISGSLAIAIVRWRSPVWLIGLIPSLILWNPIVPIYMTRAGWLPLDLLGAAFFVAFAVRYSTRK